VSEPVPWRVAWHHALYGPRGFYRQPRGPAGHFTTATQGDSGQALAQTLWTWADRYGLDGIVDVGAGRGELLQHLYACDPARPLTGLDVVARPPDLPRSIAWMESPGGGELPMAWQPDRALVVAHEWLDVVPCTVAQVDADGVLRELLAPPSSPGSCSELHRNPYPHRTNESLGSPLDGPDLEWCQRFWPTIRIGDQVEVGRQRDEAWSALLDRLAPGSVAVAIDFGHEAADRPAEGTLAAYREGRLVDPVPDGTCDLTAHVAVDSLRQTRRLRQRDAVPPAEPPDHGLASRDPAAYLGALADHSAAAALRRPGGFGDFWWVVAER
jgi:SAM-dependent MidA family methyltransferase